jgi:hypothetical protein
MDSNKSRTGMLLGLAAAAAAFGVAAMTSTASAAIAHADDFTDIVTYVDADLADGQFNLTTALSDFSSGDFVPGLTSLFQGVDDDVLAAPDNLLIGTVEALTGVPLGGPLPYDLGVPTDFADQLTYAEQTFTGAVVGDFGDIPAELAAGDYGVATYDVLLGADFASIAPLEDLILGVAASL